MRIILMGEDCRSCGETVSRSDNFCPRCGAGEPLMPRVWHMAVLVLVVQFTGLTDRPAGFYLDESSFSWNAWSLVHTGADEHGRPWPIFFESFGDWKTAPYIYLLAGVFVITGPSILAARIVSASAGVAAERPSSTIAASSAMLPA